MTTYGASMSGIHCDLEIYRLNNVDFPAAEDVINITETPDSDKKTKYKVIESDGSNNISIQSKESETILKYNLLDKKPTSYTEGWRFNLVRDASSSHQS